MRVHRPRLWRGSVLAFVLVGVCALPAAGALGPGDEPSKVLLDHLSQTVEIHYWMAHPQHAPAAFRSAFTSAERHQGKARKVKSCESHANNDVFNCDFTGFPQNEESVGVCPSNDNIVLGGANDYEGLLVSGSVTGWYWSTDGGRSVAKSGYLPPVTLGTPGHETPSGGDPVDFIPAGCDAYYAASLAYDPATVPNGPNGVAVYRTTPAALAACGGFDDPSCWPTRRVVAESDGAVFNDKEWMFVGTQAGKRYVWVTWSEFANDPSSPIGYNAVKIKAVRCDDLLVTCTQPMDISSLAQDQDVQFSDVTVGPDGRAYITWAGIEGELPGTPSGQPGQPQTFVIRLRVEQTPGSMVFGPSRVVHVEDEAIPFGGFLQANDFRVATYPKSDVVMVRGHPRVFVIWDACTFRLFDTTCIDPVIKLKYSDDDGATWVGPTILSKGGVNYFPTISADRSGTTDNIAAAWFTNAYDDQFDNTQDVVATSINPATGEARGLKRLTKSSNETEADPLLGGFFIGDYIEGTLVRNRFDVGYNANYRKAQILGVLGPPFSTAPAVNQQDNYLAVTGAN
jgi:hypothetical protein